MGTSIPDDPRPPAVRAAAEKADQMQRELIAAQTGQAPQPAPAPPAPPAPVQPQPVVVQQPQPQPTVAPHPTQATDADIEAILAMPAEPGSPLAELQHQYKSERGRRAARRSFANGGTAHVPSLQPSFHVPEVPTTPLIEDAQREAFGDELSTFIERTALRAAEKIAAERIAEVVEPINEWHKEEHARRQAAMLSMLDNALAQAGATFTFAELNKDADFNAWLKLQDPMSGASMLSLLRRAWNSQDGSRVLTIVGAYLDHAIGAPPQAVSAVPPNPAPVPPAPAARAPQIDLLSLAAPGRGPAAAPHVVLPPAQPAKQVYTRADIQSFYVMKSRGKVVDPQGVPYTADQVAWIEKDIFAAQNEGRIQG